LIPDAFYKKPMGYDHELRQERDLATEPSLWRAQLYGTPETVYQQQFVKLTACIRLSASSKHICLLYVLITD